MKTTSKQNKTAVKLMIGALLAASMALPSTSNARQGATDPIPGTSNGTTNSGGGTGGGGGGGGGGKVTTSPAPTPAPAPAPAPAPVQALVSAPLTFTAAASVNGVIPQCTGDYRIDPYYPTLSLMTVNVQTSSLNVPDGTALYITINVAGGTGYPFTSNAVIIAGQSGSGSMSEYITLGTTVTSVVISDATGAIVFAGN